MNLERNCVLLYKQNFEACWEIYFKVMSWWKEVASININSGQYHKYMMATYYFEPSCICDVLIDFPRWVMYVSYYVSYDDCFEIFDLMNINYFEAPCSHDSWICHIWILFPQDGWFVPVQGVCKRLPAPWPVTLSMILEIVLIMFVDLMNTNLFWCIMYSWYLSWS